MHEFFGLSKKILLVEEDEKIYDWFRKTVGNKAQLLWVKDKMAALALAKNENPALAIVDIHLSGTNGFEIAKEFKKNPKTSNLKIIILSEFGEDKLCFDQDFLSSLGIAGYLLKSNHNLKNVFNEMKTVII